jgi:hypothetical protein
MTPLSPGATTSVAVNGLGAAGPPQLIATIAASAIAKVRLQSLIETRIPDFTGCDCRYS